MRGYGVDFGLYGLLGCKYLLMPVNGSLARLILLSVYILVIAGECYGSSYTCSLIPHTVYCSGGYPVDGRCSKKLSGGYGVDVEFGSGSWHRCSLVVGLSILLSEQDPQPCAVLELWKYFLDGGGQVGSASWWECQWKCTLSSYACRLTRGRKYRDCLLIVEAMV